MPNINALRVNTTKVTPRPARMLATSKLVSDFIQAAKDDGVDDPMALGLQLIVHGAQLLADEVNPIYARHALSGIKETITGS